MDYPGNLLVVAAPSGAGKSSLVNAVLEHDSRLVLSVSHTTRAPRGQEHQGREYHFVDEATFREMTARGEFFEWATVHGHMYGTSKTEIETKIAAGQDIVLEIDWQGALQIKLIFHDACLIFVLPPSWEELRQRLNQRGEDHSDVIAQRLENARTEVAQAHNFDFVIINRIFEVALNDLKAIVQSQRLRYIVQRREMPSVFADLGLLN